MTFQQLHTKIKEAPPDMIDHIVLILEDYHSFLFSEDLTVEIEIDENNETEYRIYGHSFSVDSDIEESYIVWKEK